MSFSVTLLQTYFKFYSRAFPTSAAQKAVEMMTHPRIKREKRNAARGFFESTIPLANGAFLSIRGRGQKKMLLLHGWSGWIGQFEEFVRAMDPEEYTIYAVHPEGHGDSPSLASHPGRFIEAVMAAQDQVGDSFDIAVGHSLGAAALVYVETMQKSFGRLVLVAGPATIEGVLNRFAGFLGLGERSRRLFVRSMEQTVGLSVERLDLFTLAPQVQSNVLMVHDADDREVPINEARSLSKSFRRCQYLETQSFGHSRVLQDPDVVQEILGFMKAPEEPEIVAEARVQGQ